ncbi:MAG: hypothetical protein LC731_04130, partial [Acidobacteria bacterium]|nr:hypothetical protein [Acidobacteriota bacterium]
YKKIADGPEVYDSLSLAKATNRILTVARQSPSDVWIVDMNGKAEARQSTSTGKVGRAGLCWTPDGRLVYHSRESGVDSLGIMNQDGSDPRILTGDSSGNFLPTVTGDGRHLAFMSRRTGVLHIWRMDLESGAQVQLTNGSDEQYPKVSADGKWIYYNSWNAGVGSVWKVPVDGGQPSQVIIESSYHPQPSPAGNLLAYRNLIHEPGSSRWKVVSTEGGLVKYSFGAPLVRRWPIHWSRDGRAFLYIDQRDGVWNVWSQPLEGGEPKQLTYFTEGRIYFFDQSWDGKRLAVARGSESKDVVLIDNYR